MVFRSLNGIHDSAIDRRCPKKGGKRANKRDTRHFLVRNDLISFQFGCGNNFKRF